MEQADWKPFLLKSKPKSGGSLISSANWELGDKPYGVPPLHRKRQKYVILDLQGFVRGLAVPEWF